jgi:lysozyme family protein
MPNVSLTPALRAEYEQLFNSCVIRPERTSEVSSILKQIDANRARYDAVESSLGIPWSFTAVIHNMESGLSFKGHLHNGDSLNARTVNVPANRPPTGNPPFTWEVSAADALTMKKLSAATDWSLAGTLYQIERYNGWGYRLHHPHVLSPYLWSFSTHYSSGKYISDGTWSETAKSAQCGAAVLLRRMAELQGIEFADQPASAVSEPLVVPYSMKKSQDPAVVAQAEALQRWLNTFPGVFTKIDGVPGKGTSDAFHAVTGRFLPGDPRG